MTTKALNLQASDDKIIKASTMICSNLTKNTEAFTSHMARVVRQFYNGSVAPLNHIMEIMPKFAVNPTKSWLKARGGVILTADGFQIIDKSKQVKCFRAMEDHMILITEDADVSARFKPKAEKPMVTENCEAEALKTFQTLIVRLKKTNPKGAAYLNDLVTRNTQAQHDEKQGK